MGKIYSVALLGCGNRGNAFAETLVRSKDKYRISALCDTDLEQIKKLHDRFGLEDTCDFLDCDEFFEEKRADVIIIGTPDRLHVPQAIRALEQGYDILLEKPISDNRDELNALYEAYKRTGRKITVFHELRYAKGYMKCSELLDAKAIGELYAIDASERAAYWHWTQAYVKGPGASNKIGHPAILAKCSHDLDLIHHYAKSKCDTVSSVGDLRFFKPENAPEGAADRCLDCRYMETCPYSAKRVYVDAWHKSGEPAFVWPYTKVSIKYPHTEEDLLVGLRTGENGVCVFKCNVDKVDHQFVQMTFENGVKASLKMVYGAYAGRRISFYGTLGEIIFDERNDYIEVMRFGEEKEIIDVGCGQGHGGGDPLLIAEFYDVLEGTRPTKTSLEDSLECHFMGISAEESRKLNGALVKVHQ